MPDATPPVTPEHQEAYAKVGRGCLTFGLGSVFGSLLLAYSAALVFLRAAVLTSTAGWFLPQYTVGYWLAFGICMAWWVLNTGRSGLGVEGVVADEYQKPKGKQFVQSLAIPLTQLLVVWGLAWTIHAALGLFGA